METFLIILAIIYLIGYIPMLVMSFFGYMLSPRATAKNFFAAAIFYMWFWPMVYIRWFDDPHAHEKRGKYHPPKNTPDSPKTIRK